MLTFPVASGQLDAYLARPAGDGPWPAVVVVHEIFGLTADIRGLADEAARRGFLALAPDFYAGGRWWRCMNDAFRELRSGQGSFLDAVDGARSWLADRDDCTGHVGVVGFCLGGGFALMAAPRSSFGAVAVNYGEVPERAEDALADACPVVASYGARDRSMRGRPERLRAALDAAGVPHDVKTYDGVGHGFMNHWPLPFTVLGRVVGMHPGFDAEASADAWARIEAFLRHHLSPHPGEDAPGRA